MLTSSKPQQQQQLSQFFSFFFATQSICYCCFRHQQRKKNFSLTLSLSLSILFKCLLVVVETLWFIRIEILSIHPRCFISFCCSSSSIRNWSETSSTTTFIQIQKLMSAKIFLRRLTDMSTFNTLQDKLTRLNDSYLVNLGIELHH